MATLQKILVGCATLSVLVAATAMPALAQGAGAAAHQRKSMYDHRKHEDHLRKATFDRRKVEETDRKSVYDHRKADEHKRKSMYDRKKSEHHR